MAILYADPRGTLANRFWAKVNKTEGCWEWTASCDRKGYGQIMCRFGDAPKRPERAHRVAWMLTHGAMPNECVLHRCDNPKCVRPDHLFLGTVADNNRDMWSKGRGHVNGFTAESRAKIHSRLPRGDKHYARTNPELLARGERHPRTKLTSAQVATMRSEREGGALLRELAAKYRVAECTVSAIIQRRNWGHVA